LLPAMRHYLCNLSILQPFKYHCCDSQLPRPLVRTGWQPVSRCNCIDAEILEQSSSKVPEATATAASTIHRITSMIEAAPAVAAAHRGCCQHLGQVCAGCSATTTAAAAAAATQLLLLLLLLLSRPTASCCCWLLQITASSKSRWNSVRGTSCSAITNAATAAAAS
jgi:hypothetical protein